MTKITQHNYDENWFCLECDKRQAMHEVVKKAGIDSVRTVCELTGLSPQTFKNWYLHKPKLFKAVLIGVVELNKNQKGEEK